MSEYKSVSFSIRLTWHGYSWSLPFVFNDIHVKFAFWGGSRQGKDKDDSSAARDWSAWFAPRHHPTWHMVAMACPVADLFVTCQLQTCSKFLCNFTVSVKIDPQSVNVNSARNFFFSKFDSLTICYSQNEKSQDELGTTLFCCLF